MFLLQTKENFEELMFSQILKNFSFLWSRNLHNNKTKNTKQTKSQTMSCRSCSSSVECVFFCFVLSCSCFVRHQEKPKFYFHKSKMEIDFLNSKANVFRTGKVFDQLFDSLTRVKLGG